MADPVAPTAISSSRGQRPPPWGGISEDRPVDAWMPRVFWLYASWGLPLDCATSHKRTGIKRDGGVTDSWRRKVQRAEHHLGDFIDRISPIQERRSYPAPKAIEPFKDTTAYLYRVQIPESDDPLLPIIAGDILFNLRSALDHIFVALVPEADRSKRTAFPIFTDDIEAKDPATGRYLYPEARAAWQRKTAGADAAAMGVVKRFQPYNLTLQGLDPQYSSLAILGAFQNADKHRQLVLVSNGLRDPVVRQIHLDGRRVVVEPEEPLGPDRVLRNRTVVGASLVATQVTMEAEGVLDVLIGDAEHAAYHSCPGALETMLRDVGRVLDELEPLIRAG